MARQQLNDTPTTAPRSRHRAVAFARRSEVPTPAAGLEVLDAALEDLGGEWVRARHGAYTGCADCAGTEPHDQGAVRFANPRDLATIEAALPPGFVLEPLKGRGSFERYVRYLTHGCEHELTANFDWRALIESLPAPAAPTLTELVRRLFEGSITPEQVADRHPDTYLKHSGKLKLAYAEGCENRGAKRAREYEAAQTAERAERDRANRVAAAQHRRNVLAWLEAEQAVIAAQQEAIARWLDAEQEAITRWLDAERHWLATPEGTAWTAAKEAAAAEAAARARDAALTPWAIALTCADYGITGDAAARGDAVRRLIGAKPTLDAVTRYVVAEDWYTSAESFIEQVEIYRGEVADQNGGTFGAYMHVSGGDDAEAAFQYLLKQKRLHAAYPDLYDRVCIHPNYRRHWARKNWFDELMGPVEIPADEPGEVDVDHAAAEDIAERDADGLAGLVAECRPGDWTGLRDVCAEAEAPYEDAKAHALAVGWPRVSSIA